MTRFLILEWLGHWAVPDCSHGGIRPGPYASAEEARAAIEAYADKRRRGWLRGESDEAMAEREARIVRQSHAVVAIDLPPDLEET